MNTNELDDERLLVLVATIDKRLFDAGLDIKHRAWEVPCIAMRELGYVSFVLAGSGTPEMLERIRFAFRSIYREQDISVGGHIGVFMYRDIFARIGVPTGYGRVSFNPFEFVELTPAQLRIIQTEPDQLEAYLDQFFDVADVQYGTRELKKPFATMELVVRFLGLSRLHLNAASAILTGGYDYCGAVQAALLATELALKAGAAANGLSSFDLARVKRVLATQPSYVLNRYSATQAERQEVGHLVMGAQYVVSEVVRLFSERNFRSGVKPPVARRYPA